MAAEPVVFVVDDDQQACKSVCALVTSMGYPSEAFASAEAFLAAYLAPEAVPGTHRSQKNPEALAASGYQETSRPGCLVTDVRMMGMSGTELQAELAQRRIRLPIIMLTAYPRTRVTVRAMKAGAVTLLEKPYQDDELWEAIRQALAIDAMQRAEDHRREVIDQRLAQLTPLERRVLDLLLRGSPNKVIAQALDVSMRTVESRRHAIFQKMQVENIASLVRLVLQSRPDQPQ